MSSVSKFHQWNLLWFIYHTYMHNFDYKCFQCKLSHSCQVFDSRHKYHTVARIGLTALQNQVRWKLQYIHFTLSYTCEGSQTSLYPLHASYGTRSESSIKQIESQLTKGVHVEYLWLKYMFVQVFRRYLSCLSFVPYPVDHWISYSQDRLKLTTFLLYEVELSTYSSVCP